MPPRPVTSALGIRRIILEGDGVVLEAEAASAPPARPI
jgi:hypothetical protein